MANKISIRFFEDTEVRAIWDDESTKWWFSAVDIVVFKRKLRHKKLLVRFKTV